MRKCLKPKTIALLAVFFIHGLMAVKGMAQTGEETVDALVEMTWEPVIRGIAVVCEGADDVTVNAQITQAVSVLTGVSTNRISISKMS